MDNIKVYADKYFNKTMLAENLPNSDLYLNFFTSKNFDLLVKKIETDYQVSLSDSYRNDVLDTMVVCFEYHPVSLNLLNDLVLVEIRPKIMNLKFEQNRYKTNMYDNALTLFINPMELPQHFTSRKESLSFSDALFGYNDSNAKLFEQFKTG